MLTATNAINNYYFAKPSDLRNPADIYKGSSELTDNSGMPLGVSLQPPLYADQVLPFDITITFANEYGQMAVQRIYGVEILNSGAGLSVDDIVQE